MTPRTVRRALASATAAVVVCLPIANAVAGPLSPASARPTIHPGGEVNFGDVSCEIGAVMRQGHAVYLAIPASCGGIDAGKVQEGCIEPESPKGVPVSIAGAKHRGVLVYDSFTEMASRGDLNPDSCYYNDLALVRVNRHDRHLVSASVPGTAAPRRVAATMPKSGTALHFDSNSATAGATSHHGWVLDISTTAMLKTADVGAPITEGKTVVGMLLVLPKGPLPDVPLLQNPGEVYNLARAIKALRHTPGFHHVKLVRAGQPV